MVRVGYGVRVLVGRGACWDGGESRLFMGFSLDTQSRRRVARPGGEVVLSTCGFRVLQWHRDGSSCERRGR